MRDPFEDSLRDLLNKPTPHDDDACLERVLKTANRQVGVGDLFALVGNWAKVLLMVVDSQAPSASHLRRKRTAHSDDEA